MSFCKDIYDMLSEKYPNTKIYLISDEHFDHQNIINYTRKQFLNTKEMNEEIIKNHNLVVAPDDIIIFLGDLAFKNSNIKELLKSLNGHKYLIMGNHDQDFILKNYPSLGLEGVFTMPVKINDVYLSHEPLVQEESNSLTFNLIVKEFSSLADAHNYHGHIHDDFRYSPQKYTNVTCEALDYKPYFLVKTKQESVRLLPYFINSPYFGESISLISGKYHIDPSLLIKDYLYTTVLSFLNEYLDSYFIQGSVGLYKKYGFVSDFSDIDISFLFDKNLSIKKNNLKIKEAIDNVYYRLMDINNVNTEFYKRYASLRILELLVTTDNPYFVKCYVDSNLILLDSYKKSDYEIRKGQSVLEKFLNKENKTFNEDFIFPSYESNFISFYGDVANLLLQLIFAKESKEKEALVIKKLRYILNHSNIKINYQEFEDIFIRLFLRNIALLSTLNRFDEVKIIQDIYPHFKEVLKSLNMPIFFKDNLSSKSSPFMDVYEEILSIKKENALNKIQDINTEYQQR